MQRNDACWYKWHSAATFLADKGQRGNRPRVIAHGCHRHIIPQPFTLTSMGVTKDRACKKLRPELSVMAPVAESTVLTATETTVSGTKRHGDRKRRKGKHNALNLPPRDTPEYDTEYYRKYTLPSQAAKPTNRPAKLKAAKAISIQLKCTRYELGFDACIEARTNAKRQEDLCDNFIRWTAVYTMSKKNRSKQIVLQPPPLANRQPEYHLSLNKNYGVEGKDAEFGSVLAVMTSGLNGAGYGAYSIGPIKKGFTVGIYMGRKSPSKSECRSIKHADRPYLLQGVADADGGIDDSGLNGAYLGMHFINDPSFGGQPANNTMFNVAFCSDGRVVATRHIRCGEELFASYESKLCLPKNVL